MDRLELRVQVAETDADPGRIEDLTLALRQELLVADVGDVGRTAGDRAPEGARGVDAATLGSLLVAVASSTLAIAQAVTIIRGWVTRTTKDCRVKISVGDSMLTLSGQPDEQQEHLIREFLKAAVSAQSTENSE
ncbi:hypothetical protein [Nakamurella multipartita]|jgi:hypothetical protein|uniref:Uncharacterized protein n=1 Tax=Nakamurella multipartita (strain ATCC 700099 / DSM 44233 / CIP 104796 / JCM 9543 / NBRC 105858 / Y-104) TaxID=479431 RepID=C8X6L7_NAKMY|nr:hypothetical protein [Nakamurella multipartita]ACV78872.1 hypothetical protein Namu_2505 [Nakamurella multipartita DSM 44233]